MIAQSCQCPVSGETAQVVLADSTLTETLLLRGWESFRTLECELRFAPRVAIHNQRATASRLGFLPPPLNAQSAAPCSGPYLSIARWPESSRLPTSGGSPDRHPSFPPPGMPSPVLLGSTGWHTCSFKCNRGVGE